MKVLRWCFSDPWLAIAVGCAVGGGVLCLTLLLRPTDPAAEAYEQWIKTLPCKPVHDWHRPVYPVRCPPKWP